MMFFIRDPRCAVPWPALSCPAGCHCIALLCVDVSCPQLIMRFKNRYLLYEVIFEDNKIDESINAGFVYKLLKDNIIYNLGELTWGLILQSYQVKYYNPLTNLLILRAPRDHYKLIQFCATCVTKIKHRSTTMKLIHLGGTIRSCQKAALLHNKILLNQVFAQQKLLNTITNQAMNEEAEKKMAEMALSTSEDISKLET
jgi:ribonuclease P/MRP protein subunit POP5